MFSKSKKLIAVADGTAKPLSEVPDEVFSKKMLGDGFAIEPSDGSFFSPVSGIVDSISDTKHAYTIKSDDGLDILVHIGVDTVDLKGKGFSNLVNVGDRVTAGTPLAHVDLDYIRSNGLPTITPVLVANNEVLKSYDFTLGKVVGGESAVMKYRK